ncbi:MAG: large-conductance mechanosensitive channel protein MscL [Clostridia bacterium]|nr:large-conductance mechanosensitive channel protein MscL [Clostridia bacterium]
MKKFIEDFKNFAIKGNVMDLAIGVIIGGAFGKIVTSLVGDILTPLLSLISGRFNLAEAALPINDVVTGKQIAVMKYGNFLQNIVDFLLISLSIFIFIRLISRFKRKEEKKVEVKLTQEVILLTEIRDLLKGREEEAAKEAKKLELMSHVEGRMADSEDTPI